MWGGALEGLEVRVGSMGFVIEGEAVNWVVAEEEPAEHGPWSAVGAECQDLEVFGVGVGGGCGGHPL